MAPRREKPHTPFIANQGELGPTEVGGDQYDGQGGPWTRAGNPYIVTGWVNVPPGQMLTIEPGVVVKFNKDLGIGVQGTLDARGTDNARITFTSNGDLSPDWWNSITFADGSSGTLDRCVIQYGGYYSDTNILCVGNASPAITHCEITHSDVDGIRLYGTSSPTITGCTIAHNGGDGVEVNDSASPALTGNAITDNDVPVWILNGAARPRFADNQMTGNRRYDAVAFSGNIPDNAAITWDRPSVPYLVHTGMAVGAGASLTIPAGTTVKFADDQGMAVYGTLEAVGTSEEPILFTALTDDETDSRDTNRDGMDTTPEGDYWSAIYFADGSQGTLERCVVKYGGYYHDGNIVVVNASPTITHCEISHSDVDGIRLWGASSSTLTGNIVENNGGWAFLVGAWSALPTASGNTARGNKGDAFYLVSSTIPEGQDLAWNMEPAVYAVEPYAVASGATLTVAPGAIVKFVPGAGIAVHPGGRMTATGTESAPIAFTSIRDDEYGGDTNGDGESAGEPHDWGCLSGFDTDGRVEYCTFRFGGCGNTLELSETASFPIAHCTFERNGGTAVRVGPGYDDTISDCTVTGNFGHGIYCEAGKATIRNCALSNNGANANGDGIWLNNLATGVVEDCTVTENQEDGIDASNNCNVIVRNCVVADNGVEGTDQGYGILFQGASTGIIEDCQIRGSYPRDGIYLDQSGNAIIRNTAITGSKRDGIGARNASAVITGCEISQNDGDGIDCDGARLEVSGCAIEENVERGAKAAGVHVKNSGKATIHQSSIARNGGYGVWNETTADVDATGNSWGDPSGPYHETANPEGAGNSVSDYVVFAPFLKISPIVPEADIALSADSHDFGAVTLDSAEVWTLVVSNLGDSTLSVQSVESSGEDFTVMPESFAVPGDDSAAVAVTYRPSSTGLGTATLTVTSDDPDEQILEIAVGGTGVIPRIRLADTSHDFGAVAPDSAAAWVLVVSNPGSAPLSVTIASDDSEFAVRPEAFSVPAADSVEVEVAFLSGSEGSKSAVLAVRSNDPERSVLEVELSALCAVPNQPPSASVLPLEGEQSGDIPIGYTLEDVEEDILSILCSYSTDGGASWGSASVEGSQENLSAAEYSGTVVWKSGDDLEGLDLPEIRFRITPLDAQQGTSGEVVFHVDNNQVPAVELGDMTGEMARDIPVTYRLSDPEGDSLRMICEFSSDGGASWSAATVAGDTTGIAPDRYSGEITWRSFADLGYGSHADVRFRVTPADEDPGEPAMISIAQVRHIVADYDGDMDIDFDDLAIFLVAWEEGDLTRDIGPTSGEVPELIPRLDKKLDFEDLVTFIVMWNWSAGIHPQPAKLARAEYEPEQAGMVRVLSPRSDLPQDGTFLVEIVAEDVEDLLAAEVAVHYDPALTECVEVSEGNVFSAISQGAVFLEKVDEENGFVLINSGRLGRGPVGKGVIAQVRFLELKDGQERIRVEYGLKKAKGEDVEIGRQFVGIESHPGTCRLFQNTPNPFNSQTVIGYALSETRSVRLSIYDLLGRKVRHLVDGMQEPGYYTIGWDGRDEVGWKVGSGLYLYRFTAESRGERGDRVVRTRKMMMVR